MIPIQGGTYDGEAELLRQIEAGVAPYTPRSGRWWNYYRQNLGAYTMGGDGVERLMSISTIKNHQTSGYTASASDFAIGMTCGCGFA